MIALIIALHFHRNFTSLSDFSTWVIPMNNLGNNLHKAWVLFFVSMPATASSAIEQKTNDPILFMCNFLLSFLDRRNCNKQKIYPYFVLYKSIYVSLLLLVKICIISIYQILFAHLHLRALLMLDKKFFTITNIGNVMCINIECLQDILQTAGFLQYGCTWWLLSWTMVWNAFSFGLRTNLFQIRLVFFFYHDCMKNFKRMNEKNNIFLT